MRSFLSFLLFLGAVLSSHAQVYVINGMGTVGGSSGDLAGQPTTANAVSFSYTIDTSTSQSTSTATQAGYYGAISDVTLSITGSTATFTAHGDWDFAVFDEYDSGGSFYDGYGIFTHETDPSAYGITYDSNPGGGGATGSLFFMMLVLMPGELYSDTDIPDPYTTTAQLGEAAGEGAFAAILLGQNSDDAFGDEGLLLGIFMTDYTVTAVPEPSTYAAIAGGIVLLMTVLRRNRRLLCETG